MYPVLKDSVRLKPLAHAVYVGDAYTGKESLLEPLGGFILSLCSGETDITTIGRCVAAAYGVSREEGLLQAEGTLKAQDDYLDWQESPRRAAQAYAMEDFFYRPAPLEHGRYSAPVSATLVLTNRCNFQCIYCFNSSGPRREREMSGADWLEAARQIADMGVPFVDLTGGEPLVLPFLPEMLERFHQAGAVVTLFTNGSLIDRDWVKRLSALRPIRVQVSLDSALPDIHHRLTDTQNSFAAVTRAIEALSAAGVYVNCKALLLPDTWRELGALARLCARLGARALTLDTYDLSALGRGDRRFFLTPRESAEAERLVEETRSTLPSDMALSYAYGRKRWAGEADIVACGAFQTGFTLLSDGAFSLCEKTAGLPEACAGVFPKLSVAELWAQTRALCPLDVPQSRFDEPCQSCASFARCRGGCPAMRRLVTDHPFAADPRCWKAEYADNPYRL